MYSKKEKFFKKGGLPFGLGWDKGVEIYDKKSFKKDLKNLE